MNDRNLGITFPFQEDLKGKYLKMDKIEKDMVKSNLTNLLTTTKGSRFMRPDFGTNLSQFMFEPMDEQTYGDIRNEIVGAVSKFMSEIEIQNVEAQADEDNYFVGIIIVYSISTGVFKEKDTINLLF